VLRTSLGQLIDSVARPSSGVQSYNVHRAELAKWMAAIRWTQGHDAEKTAQEALLLAGNDEAIG
jgi:hypothetical protein